MGFLGRIAASAGLLGERLITLSPIKLGLVVAGTSGIVAGGITVVAPALVRTPTQAVATLAPPATERVPAPADASPPRTRHVALPDMPAVPVPLVPPPEAILPPTDVRPAPARPPSAEPRPAPAAALPPVVPQAPPDPEPAPSPKVNADGTWQSTPYPEMRDKADAFLMVGDVTSARLWLSTASDKGDAEAMFKLAETFDPTMLGEWRVVGMTSDKSKARALYQKALTGGVEAARERIDRLGR